MFEIKTKKSKSLSKVHTKPAFTLIEALVVLFVFSIITLTFYSVFSLGGGYIIESKNRFGAVAVANEKMEIIRNLKYDDVGIVGGIPSGKITAEEDVFENKKNYHVKTFIQYVDDPFDGVSPTDLDYKRVKITVSWQGVKGATSNTSLVSRFVPPGIEQSLSGGTLSVNVINSNGEGVPQASVHITNTDVSPAVNVTAMTDNTGNLMLPGAKQSIQQYYITVTKNGYETVETIDPASVAYSVTDTPASVVEGVLNVKSIVADRLANLEITAVDYLNNPLPNTAFNLKGGRILGSDMSYSPAAPQYNLIENKITNASGESNSSNISPGQFFISNIQPIPGYTLIGLDSFSSYEALGSVYAFLVPPGETKDLKIRFAKDSDSSILVNVVEDSDGTPLSDASVTLTNGAGYNETLGILPDGNAFFPVSSDPFATGTYNVSVTAPGYVDQSVSVDVNNFTTLQVRMAAS